MAPPSLAIRQLNAELLDSLPHDAPEAIASRRDLVTIDRLMGNYAWLLRHIRALATAHTRPLSILELGAGSGSLGRLLIERRLSDRVQLHGYDLAPRPPLTHWRQEWHWHEGDLFNAPWVKADLVVACLVLHHFDSAHLSQLGMLITTHASRLLAVEPRRDPLSLLLAGGLRYLGMNRVTQHDARASVRAGFKGEELSQALALPAHGWQVSLHHGLLGSYRLMASRSNFATEQHP